MTDKQISALCRRLNASPWQQKVLFEELASNWHTRTPTEEGLYLCNVIISEDDDNVPYYILIYKNNEFRTKITDFVIPKEHIIKWQKIEER